MLASTQLQRNTLRLYAEMLARPARFVFAWGEDIAATGLPAAVSIAGGASLTVDPDAAQLKAVFRRGGLDFLVTNLDEALRVLKNELRKRTPVSVAIAAGPADVLSEMNARGVEPDLEVSAARRSLALAWLDPASLPSPSATALLTSRNWQETHCPAATTADLRTLDVRLVDLLPDTARLNWLRRIPHYHRPAPAEGRILWLTPSEQKTHTT